MADEAVEPTGRARPATGHVRDEGRSDQRARQAGPRVAIARQRQVEVGRREQRVDVR